MKFIKEFEGLRGLMAMWVVLGHYATTIEMSISPLPPNLYNSYAVDVFIILSGFAITTLLEKRQEPYGTYLTRRFFRIFPVYLLFFFMSVLTIHQTLEVFQVYDGGYMAETRVKLALASMANAPWHILSHITALHSVVPDAILPFSAYAFLGQAWSISLEWQFYLIAPFVIAALKGPKTIIQCLKILTIVVLTIGYSKFAGDGYIGRHIHFFAIGIGTYYFLSYAMSEKRYLNPAYIRPIFLAGLIFLMAYKSEAIIPYAIWLTMLYAVLGNHHKLDRPSGLLSAVTTSAPVMFLGKMSYSIYLSHMLVIVLTLTIFNRFAPDMSAMTMSILLFVIVLPVTVLVSMISYELVEKPFQKYGKILTSKNA